LAPLRKGYLVYAAPRARQIAEDDCANPLQDFKRLGIISDDVDRLAACDNFELHRQTAEYRPRPLPTASGHAPAGTLSGIFGDNEFDIIAKAGDLAKEVGVC
jgi:hypothetical protein